MGIDFPKGTGGFMNPEKVLAQLGVRSEMKIADFGCGHGYFAIPVAKMVGPAGKIYAVDVLAEALDAVNSQTRLENIGNIETVRANLETLGGSKIPDNSIDLVLLHNVLFQTQKKSDVLKEAKRVLKPGGFLDLIDWQPANAAIGPQGGWRIGPEEAKQLAQTEGFAFQHDFDAGQYHYGLNFLKSN